jgi:hypothetical protein
MSRLNWDRAHRQALVARAVDYSARMDAGEAMLWDTPDRARQQTRKSTVSKARRLRRDAASAGVAVADLKRRRREIALQKRLLAAEARRRGITVKQLRRMIEHGQVAMPTLPEPSGQVAVSSGRSRKSGPARRAGPGPAPARQQKRHGPQGHVEKASTFAVRNRPRRAPASGSTPVCVACGTPISANGRCGCS